MENQKGFEKIFDENGKEYIPTQVNCSQKFTNGGNRLKSIQKDKSLKNLQLLERF
jgi:hypothetical protein